MSTFVSWPGMILFVICLLYAMPQSSYDDVLSGGIQGDAFSQMLYVCTNKKATIILLWLIICTNFLAGFSLLQSSSRVVYAFARDGGLPCSSHLQFLSSWNIPYVAILSVSFLAFILVLPYLKQPVVFYALTSLAVIGMNISYAIPIALRVWKGKEFVLSAFNLGNFGEHIGAVAVLYVAFLVVILTFPQYTPITPLNMNYACLLVGTVLFFAIGAWVLSARKWFKGPPTTNVALRRAKSASFKRMKSQSSGSLKIDGSVKRLSEGI